MGKAKTPDQWAPAYRNRMEKAYAKNPFATKTEARRGENSKEARAENKNRNEDWLARVEANKNANKPSTKEWDERTIANLKAKQSNVKLREELGILTPGQAKEATQALKEMIRDCKAKFNTVAGSDKDHRLTEKIRANYAYLWEAGLVRNDDSDSYGEIWYPEN